MNQCFACWMNGRKKDFKTRVELEDHVAEMHPEKFQAYLESCTAAAVKAVDEAWERNR